MLASGWVCWRDGDSAENKQRVVVFDWGIRSDFTFIKMYAQNVQLERKITLELMSGSKEDS